MYMQTISRPEMYKLIAENSTDVIYTVGLDEKFRFVSPSVEKMFGYKPKEVLGKRRTRVSLSVKDPPFRMPVTRLN